MRRWPYQRRWRSQICIWLAGELHLRDDKFGRKVLRGVAKQQPAKTLRAVLGETAIAGTSIAEPAFQLAEHVLDVGAHLAEPAIATALCRTQFARRLGLLHRL